MTRSQLPLTNGCTGQISAVTFCAKTRTKAAIKNLLGEPGVEAVGKGQRLFSALNRSIIKLKIAPILKIQSTYRGKQT
jgi:hypothetical protein